MATMHGKWIRGPTRRHRRGQRKAHIQKSENPARQRSRRRPACPPRCQCVRQRSRRRPACPPSVRQRSQRRPTCPPRCQCVRIYLGRYLFSPRNSTTQPARVQSCAVPVVYEAPLPAEKRGCQKKHRRAAGREYMPTLCEDDILRSDTHDPLFLSARTENRKRNRRHRHTALFLEKEVADPGPLEKGGLPMLCRPGEVRTTPQKRKCRLTSYSNGNRGALPFFGPVPWLWLYIPLPGFSI